METIQVNKNVTIQVETNKLKKRQVLILKNMLKNTRGIEAAINYVSSFESNGRGLRHSTYRYDVAATRNSLESVGKDLLAEKKAGTILEKFERQFDVNTSKRPDETALGDWIGVEIECFIPLGVLPNDHDIGECDCSNDEIDSGVCVERSHFWSEYESESAARERIVDAFKKARIKNVTIKGDGSIRNPDNTIGIEVCVLFKRGDKSTLERTCELLKSFGAAVNKSCGLHVHLDMRDCESTRQVNQRGTRLFNALPVLQNMVPASRRSNTYCQLSKGSMRGSRYHAVNMTAYNRFKTIEVRLHSATTDFFKINNWIELLFKISRSPKMTKERVSSIMDLSARLQLSDVEVGYIMKRTETFSNIELQEAS